MGYCGGCHYYFYLGVAWVISQLGNPFDIYY